MVGTVQVKFLPDSFTLAQSSLPPHQPPSLLGFLQNMLPLSHILRSTTRRRFAPKSLSLFHRFLSTDSSPIAYSLSHPIYTVWGANTGVGKTLVSAGIAAASLLSNQSTKFVYIKPVQTGFPTDSDSKFVYRKVSDIFHHRQFNSTVFASNQTLKVSAPAAKGVLGFGGENIGEIEDGFCDLRFNEERILRNEGAKEVSSVSGASELVCKTIYGWREAVSPHLAAQRENAVVKDSDLLEMLRSCLVYGLEGKSEIGEDVSGVFSLIETAGGVASPGPSGSLQCDLYR